jgi:hypothetical protein
VNNVANSYLVQEFNPGDSTGAVSFRAVRMYYKLQISPDPAGATFADVPHGHPFHRFVEALYASGITGGCGRLKDGRYRIRYFKSGSKRGPRVQEMLGHVTRAKAEEIHSQRVHAGTRAKARAEGWTLGRKAGLITFGQLAADYRETHGPEMAVHSRERVEQVCRLYLGPFFGHMLADEIKAGDWKRYRNERLTAGAFVGEPGDASTTGSSGCQVVSNSTGPFSWTINNDTTYYTVEVNFAGTTDASHVLNSVRVGYKLQISPDPSTATFADVPVGHPFHRFVEALYASGITGGCGGGNYCPDAPVTRGQMAVFLAGALGLHWAP